MNRPRRIVIAAGLALMGLLTIGWTVSWAQAKKTPAEPVKKIEDPAKKPAEAAKKPAEQAKKPAEPVKKPSAPLELIPAGTVLLATGDGSTIHQAAWEKTAAYEAFAKSGLIDSFSKLIRGILEQIPEERVQSATEIYDFITEHGLTISIGFGPGDGPAIPYLTVIAHDAGPHGEALNHFIEGLDDSIELTKEQVSKRNVSRVLIPGTPGVEVAWWTEGQHLVITGGIGAVDAAIAVAEAQSPGFATSANGKKLAAKSSFDRTSLFWFDFAALRSRFGAIPLPINNGTTVAAILETVGLESFNQILVQSGYKGRTLWSTVDVDAPAPRKGLMGLADPKKATMTLDDLPPLPANNVGFFAHSMSLAGAYDQLLQLTHSVVKFAPPEVSEKLDEVLGQMPEILGCDLRDDILAALGPVQCIYSDANQGVLGSEYGLIIQVADAAKLRSTLQKVVARIADEVPAEFVTTIERERHGQNLVTFRCGGGAMNPTMLISDKWLCVGMSHQIVESFAMRLKGVLPAWKPDAETAEALAAVPKKFASISVTYPRHTYRVLVSLTPFLLEMGEAAMSGVQQLGLFPPIELAATALDIPPAELVIKPLFPNVSWAVVDETGIHMTTRSSAPPVPILGGVDTSTIAVSAVAVALLLPAVQQAREAARRTQSKNNLKQITLALHNFHDTMQHFPQGTLPSKDLEPEDRQSWMVQILPYLDQAPLYNEMAIDLQESAKWNDDSLEEFILTQIPVFRNPSRAEDDDEEEPATTDYAGWAGVGKDAPTEEAKDNKKGIFGYDRATKIADITDGTSNTIMVSDVVADGRGPWAQGGKATIRALTAKPYINGVDGIGSPHVGGFHACLADGSVRFISNNIDPDLLEALATRAGGEVIGDF